MKDLWLTMTEVEQLTGWSQRTIRHKAANRELQTRPSSVAGANGKRHREYLASSLPAEMYGKLLQQRVTADAIIIRPGAEVHPSPKYALPTEQERIALTPEEDEQASYRFGVIAKLVEFRNNTNGSKPPMIIGGAEARSLTDVVRYIAQVFDKDERTIWNWYTRFTTSGYAALADRTRSDKGKSRVFRAHPQAAAMAQDKYLNQKLPIRLVHEALLQSWPKLRSAAEAEPPSYEATRCYLRALPKPLAILAREGERQFEERCQPYLIRRYDDRAVNEIWCGDHMVHDVWVVNDFLPGKAHGDATRLFLTAFMDMRSRKIVGAAWSVFPSSHSINSALRVGIHQYGPPKRLYIDNGKDFQKISGADKERAGVLARLGIEAQHTLVYHGQSKPIESFFRTLHQRFDILWGNAYAGNSPAKRPEACTAAIKLHRDFQLGKASSSPLPLASEFIQTAAQWLDEYNSAHRHSGRGMNGKTPDEIFFAAMPRDQRPQIDPLVLAPLFWDRQKRRVREGGTIEIYGHRYEPADGDSLARLFNHIERDILIACDPNNLGEAIALDLDGNFLGYMRSQKLLEHGPVSHEDVKASLRARRQIRRVHAQHLDVLAQVRDTAGHVTSLDALKQRAGVQPAAIRGVTRALPAPRVASKAAVAAPQYTEDAVAELLGDDN